MLLQTQKTQAFLAVKFFFFTFISNVFTAIQPLIMETVSAAILASTTVVAEKLHEITDDYDGERISQTIKAEVKHWKTKQDRLGKQATLELTAMSKNCGLEESKN